MIFFKFKKRIVFIMLSELTITNGSIPKKQAYKFSHIMHQQNNPTLKLNILRSAPKFILWGKKGPSWEKHLGITQNPWELLNKTAILCKTLHICECTEVLQRIKPIPGLVYWRIKLFSHSETCWNIGSGDTAGWHVVQQRSTGMLSPAASQG